LKNHLDAKDGIKVRDEETKDLEQLLQIQNLPSSAFKQGVARWRLRCQTRHLLLVPLNLEMYEDL